MLTSSEIYSISILFPFQKGKAVVEQIVPFKVFREGKQYRAIPLIISAERKTAGLAEELCFTFDQNRIVTVAETNEAGLHAINNIAGELRMLRIV